MDVLEQVERLARRVPGVAGYVDQERARETDKLLRERLARELDAIKRTVEEEERRLAELPHLDHLARLGRLRTKLDGLANAIRFAARGYRGLLDPRRLTEATLARLYAFDLGLLDELDALSEAVAALAVCPQDNGGFAATIARVDETLDALARTAARRDQVLIGE